MPSAESAKLLSDVLASPDREWLVDAITAGDEASKVRRSMERLRVLSGSIGGDGPVGQRITEPLGEELRLIGASGIVQSYLRRIGHDDLADCAIDPSLGAPALLNRVTSWVGSKAVELGPTDDALKLIAWHDRWKRAEPNAEHNIPGRFDAYLADTKVSGAEEWAEWDEERQSAARWDFYRHRPEVLASSSVHGLREHNKLRRFRFAEGDEVELEGATYGKRLEANAAIDGKARCRDAIAVLRAIADRAIAEATEVTS